MSKHESIAAAGAVYYLFGATGDLARRKLFPALFSLYKEGKLAEEFRRRRTCPQTADERAVPC